MPPGDAHPPLSPPIKVPLTVVDEHPCPYLPGRTAQTRAFAAASFPPDLYHRFMDANFRRAGSVFYQPICHGCRECMAIRIPVDAFRPSKSQRRCRRRNQDLGMEVGEPCATDEKYELYRRYVAARHATPVPEDREGFEGFLYTSPVQTVEVCYREGGGRLLAVGICDGCSHSLSSVYFYYDPAESRRRSLGTFGVLYEIELTRQMHLAHYYLGYWVAGCRAMRYKADFRPCEVLHADGVWREAPPPFKEKPTA